MKARLGACTNCFVLNFETEDPAPNDSPSCVSPRRGIERWPAFFPTAFDALIRYSSSAGSVYPRRPEGDGDLKAVRRSSLLARFSYPMGHCKRQLV
jgi:hypothetical protein